MIKKITCTTCPMGCDMLLEHEDGKILSLTGNRCARGKAYAENEFFHPARVLTTVLYVKACDSMLPVRSDRPIPKDRLFECLRAVKGIRVVPPVHRGDILYAGIAGDANIIASADM
ncbi:MAG: DUF1667 domain-containing protein [Clostridia bacterium]|nr:DUF1667 domain-containing protein [Clostridia bacterium]MDR3643476.1 DUF1667 domain-containing protein [Clostridia bacterium]